MKCASSVKFAGAMRAVPVEAAARSTTVARLVREQTGGSTRPSVSVTRSPARTLRKADMCWQPGKARVH